MTVYTSQTFNLNQPMFITPGDQFIDCTFQRVEPFTYDPTKPQHRAMVIVDGDGRGATPTKFQWSTFIGWPKAAWPTSIYTDATIQNFIGLLVISSSDWSPGYQPLRVEGCWFEGFPAVGCKIEQTLQAAIVNNQFDYCGRGLEYGWRADQVWPNNHALILANVIRQRNLWSKNGQYVYPPTAEDYNLGSTFVEAQASSDWAGGDGMQGASLVNSTISRNVILGGGMEGIKVTNGRYNEISENYVPGIMIQARIYQDGSVPAGYVLKEPIPGPGGQTWTQGPAMTMGGNTDILRNEIDSGNLNSRSREENVRPPLTLSWQLMTGHQTSVKNNRIIAPAYGRQYSMTAASYLVRHPAITMADYHAVFAKNNLFLDFEGEHGAAAAVWTGGDGTGVLNADFNTVNTFEVVHRCAGKSVGHQP